MHTQGAHPPLVDRDHEGGHIPLMDPDTKDSVCQAQPHRLGIGLGRAAGVQELGRERLLHADKDPANPTPPLTQALICILV